MSQSTDRKLRRIAKKLPTVYIKKPINKIEFEGSAKKIIHTEETAIVDHYDRLKRIYNIQGSLGVLKYIKHAESVGRQQAPYIKEWQKQLNAEKTTRWQRFVLWLKQVYTAFQNLRHER